jgi:hypothetical protein
MEGYSANGADVIMRRDRGRGSRGVRRDVRRG